MMRLFLAAIFGSVIYLIFGWIVFERLLGKYMALNTTNITGFKKNPDDSSMVFLILSCASYSLFLTLILGHWTKTYSFTKGFKIGAIAGTLIAIMTDTYWYSTSNFFNSLAPVVADIFAATLTVGLMGGFISLALGYKRIANKI